MTLNNYPPKTTYEQKQSDKKARFEELAENARERALNSTASAMRQLSGIEPGQPILVGHHSEKRHRKALEKHDDQMRKAIDENEKANYYQRKAAKVGTGGISSDDPEAIQQLKDKLDNREEVQERMKAVNAAWRKLNKNPHSNITLEALSKLSENDRKIVLDFKPERWEKGPMPGYAISNNNAEIRRLKDRIEKLQTKRNTAPVEDIQGEDFKLVQNVDENRIQFFFDCKPDADIRDILKSNGFRWSRLNMAWQRQLTDNGIYAGQIVVKLLQKNE